MNGKLLFTFVLSVFLLVMPAIANADIVVERALFLSQEGKSDYKIVLPENPLPVQQNAANELQRIFFEISGARLPIIETNQINDETLNESLVIGPSPISQHLLDKCPDNCVNESEFPYDTTCIKRVDNSIVLTGHSQRGMLYAVYTFLEEQLGCRWWTSKESTIPHSPSITVVVEKIDYCHTPKLVYRESFYRDAFDGPFATRMKCNGANNKIADDWGSHHIFQFFVHSFEHLISPMTYFKDHPDWFPEIDGVRKAGFPGWANPPEELKEFFQTIGKEHIHDAGTQLCLTNEEMRQELTKNALAALATNPKASFISISQNDWYGYCTCSECEKVAEEEGSQSGVMLRFVNKVAEDIEKVYPDIYVETLAYQYTRKPPKITRPRKNVVVRLCSIECSFVQSLEGEQNKSFKDDMQGWSEMADNLFVWDYVTNFPLYLLPFPNYRVWKPNIEFFIDHSVIGLFEQGDYHTASGDFVQLRNWVMSKLLWNPNLDQNALIDEFIAGYYAPELVPVIRDYLNTLSDAAEKSGVHLGIFRYTTSDWFDYDSIIKATDLFDQAEEIAGQLESNYPGRYSGLVQKIQRERVPLDLVWLKDYNIYKLESKLTGKRFNGPTSPKQLSINFKEKLALNHITQHKEWLDESIDQFTQSFIDRYDSEGSEPSDPDICRSLSSVNWLDIQELEMNLSNKGSWTFIVSDENASNKKAVMMPSTHYEWATSWSVNRYLSLLSPVSATEQTSDAPVYHLYLFARCDAGESTGEAMTVGVYDTETKQGVLHQSIPVAQIAGNEYTMLDLGTTALRPGQYFWAAPTSKPEGVEKVYVDRLVIVRKN